MKTVIFIILSFISYLNATGFLSYDLPLEEGKIELKIEGNQKGFSTIYFKDYGKEVAIYEEFSSKIMFKEKETKRITIIKDNQETVIDLNHKIAIKRKSLHSSLVKIFNTLNQADKEYILSYPSKDILGFECQDIIIDGKKACYNGIFELSSNIDIFGFKVKKSVVNFSQEHIPAEYFTLKNDIKIIHKSENLQKAKNIIKSMLE